MAKDPTVITVEKCEKDTYGNLKVTDTLGNETRINAKHENLHPLFQENVGRAIKLIWANYKGKDYVDDAELFDGMPPEDKRVEPITAGVVVSEYRKPAPEEIGMWFKEVGKLIVAGKLDDSPYGKALKLVYFTRMTEVLGIKEEKGG